MTNHIYAMVKLRATELGTCLSEFARHLFNLPDTCSRGIWTQRFPKAISTRSAAWLLARLLTWPAMANISSRKQYLLTYLTFSNIYVTIKVLLKRGNTLMPGVAVHFAAGSTAWMQGRRSK